MPTPSFPKKVFRKVPDVEGRVLDPFECGGMDVMESLCLCQELGLSKDLGFLHGALRGGRPAFAEAASRRQV